MLVIVLFLQTWRAAVIPIVAIPISLVGTFFVMSLFGFTLNNLSLFGLVLAIGIVVDDAIVVVENVERNIAAGLSPRDAAITSDGRGRRRADRDRAGAVRGVHSRPPSSPASPGQFYRQFALTIAGATVISLIVSLTLSPAMCALLLKPHDPSAQGHAGARSRSTASSACSIAASTGCRSGYGWLAGRTVRFARHHAGALCRRASPMA